MDDSSPNVRDVRRPSIPAFGLLILIALSLILLSITGQIGSRAADIAPLASDTRVVHSLQDSFNEIAARAEPGVVSITSVQLSESSGNLSRSSTEEELENFLKKYFDGIEPAIPSLSDEEETAMVSSAGSGAIVRRQGSDFFVLTNYHVVADAYRVTVRISGNTMLRGTVIGTDPLTDIAVVRISSPQLSDKNIIPMGDSSTVKVGSWALAMGSPYGFDHSLTVGVVSALNRELEEGDTVYPNLIQTDASINKGNSGGPLLDIQGRIIGINTAIASPTGGSIGIGFALPVNIAKGVLDELITEGRVVRGWLGVGIQELSPPLQTYYQSAGGVLIASVSKNSPADKAGLRSEDVITKIGAVPTGDVETVQKTVADTKPGTSIPFTIVRGEKLKIVQVTIGLSPLTPKGRPAAPEARGGAGIRVRSITKEMSARLGSEEETGVLVVEVIPSSPADEAGLEEGDIISKLNGQLTETEERFSSMLRQVQPNGIVVLRVIREGTPRIIGFTMEAE